MKRQGSEASFEYAVAFSLIIATNKILDVQFILCLHISHDFTFI